jgi:hypothetical protein
MNKATCTMLIAAAAVVLVADRGTFVSAQGSSGAVGPQFLSLPMHPRDDAGGDTEGGIERRGSHFIWETPLANSQPPGMTFGNQSAGPAAVSPAASSSGLSFGGGTDVAVSTVASGPYHGETGAASLSTGVILAGSNRIYPGACGSNPCGVMGYE